MYLLKCIFEVGFMLLYNYLYKQRKIQYGWYLKLMYIVMNNTKHFINFSVNVNDWLWELNDKNINNENLFL